MRTFITGTAVLALSTGLLAACGETTGPTAAAEKAGVLQLVGYSLQTAAPPVDRGVHWTVQPGENDVTPEQVIQAPDTVAAGQSFEVTVTTLGPEGCWSAHSQDVRLSGNIVELKPFDVHSGAEVCTRILLFLTHTSSITLHEPGEYVLRVSGRRAHQDDEWDTPVAAERAIVVR